MDCNQNFLCTEKLGRVETLFTINTIKNRSLKYQVNVVSTMLGRAKNHPNKTKDMVGAIKVFDDWLKKYKRKKNEK